ncbi:FGGY-family carbohydrate kinase [Herbiconiux sp. YIM B11900]|uniref:FGGY-family carbohydrate kinase n=1 Tax=Herbiconiux sp. YIM B11900 TaxID=3404131 RepID=UPI003F84E373
MPSHYLAIDIGTESARSAVFTEHGQRIGDGSAVYPTDFPRPGWAEQDPIAWWNSAADAARQALAEAGLDEVDGIAVATTASSVVFLGSDGRPLRPAILWMDARATEQSARTATTEHPALAFSGGSDSSEWLVPKAMWVAEHEPELYRDAAFIGESVDYLTWRLTGEWVGSRMNATCKWNYDHREPTVPHDLYEMLGVGDLGAKLPQRIEAVGDVAGTLSEEAAAKLGLRNRPVVGVGGIDAHLSLIPLQALSAHPVSIVAGTSNAFIAEMDEPLFSPTIWGPYPHALSADKWLVEGGQVSAGSSLTWLAERVLGYNRDRIQALISDAAAEAPVRHGLMVLDNFMGNRTPLRDPLLRGGILGASLGSTPAQLYRATVESVAYGTRQVLDSFAACGVDTSEVFVTGGIRHNALWLQTMADVLGRPVRLVSGENLTLMACAAIAAAASGGGGASDLATTRRLFVPKAVPVEHDPTVTGLFDEAYAVYRGATAATTFVHHALHRLAAR